MAPPPIHAVPMNAGEAYQGRSMIAAAACTPATTPGVQSPVAKSSFAASWMAL
jgi:hypothetical protein